MGIICIDSKRFCITTVRSRVCTVKLSRSLRRGVSFDREKFDIRNFTFKYCHFFRYLEKRILRRSAAALKKISNYPILAVSF